MKGGFLTNNLKTMAHNETVLYTLSILAIVNLIGYILNENSFAIILFLLLGYGMTRFTKNMVYVLLSTILITNFIVKISSLTKFKF